MNLFEKKEHFMHSGGFSNFKIECDALTDEDIETLAYLISQKFNFFRVNEVLSSHKPRLGIALQKYINPDSKNSLIVDDVLTTGASMEDAKFSTWAEYPDGKEVIGVVIFARGEPPEWVTPMFWMWHHEEEI